MSHFDYVQYIIVRKDLVEKMGYGKTAAQVAHASLSVILGRDQMKLLRQGDTSCIVDNPDVIGWFEGAFTKLVCYVKTKQKLINLSERLDSEGIKNSLIWDACRTVLDPEEQDGTTLTCMGVIPLHRNNVPKHLSKLQLL